MNLAWKDVRRQGLRFVATGLGLGLLFSVVLAMGGIYRGLVEDATLLVDRMEADLWIVQRDTRGPFAERSTVAPELEDRARAVLGVVSARSFSFNTIQRPHAGRSLRIAVVGLSWPGDRGDDLPLVEGRPIRAAHRELIADRSLGLRLGERIRLGDDDYTVVGLTRGLNSSSGDAVAFATQRDALDIQAYQPPEAVRIEREGRATRLTRSDLASDLLEARARDDRGKLPALAPAPPSAVLVRIAPGQSLSAVRARFAAWRDVSVYTSGEQRGFLQDGVVEKTRQQLGLFRGILTVVSAIVLALILFNMTVAKSREIALLKLMGAHTRIVVQMILQQALMLGALGLSFAIVVSQVAFAHFPRRVVVGPPEIGMVVVLVTGICVLSSLAGIAKALRIPPTLVLAG